MNQDTIIAIATPPQTSAVGIIRISGPEALSVVREFIRVNKKPLYAPKPRFCYYASFYSHKQELLDNVIFVYFKAPYSYTGEDICEIHGHGNPLLLQNLVAELLTHNAHLRQAEPGEFTKRAFLNQKLDLSQAEAVHEIISASSEVALKNAMNRLDGYLSTLIQELRLDILSSLALIEASFEFPEEDIQTFDPQAVKFHLSTALQKLKPLESSFCTASYVESCVKVALIGSPNVGKSSLLNMLLVQDRAIVSDIAGTTRDVVEGTRFIKGIRFNFFDTAGIRDTEDKIEALGIQRSLNAIESADIILEIIDASQPQSSLVNSVQNIKKVSVLNKLDVLVPLDGQNLSFQSVQNYAKSRNCDIALSAKHGFGIRELEDTIFQMVIGDSVQNSVQINSRQRHHIIKAIATCERLLSENWIWQETEILAEEMRDLARNLQETLGEISSEEILGDIFSKFCIGK